MGGTIIVGLLVLAALTGAGISVYKAKKNKTGCSGGCGNCSSKCH